MKNIYEHLISKYGEQNFESNLYSLIEKLQSEISLLESEYRDLLVHTKNLEEIGIETSNLLHELQKSIEAVDDRIDILYGEK